MLSIPLLPPGLQRPPQPGSVSRELSPRSDQLPVDAQVDLPEIQQSWKVSFSDDARATAGESFADGRHQDTDPPLPWSVRQALARYRAMAGE